MAHTKQLISHALKTMSPLYLLILLFTSVTFATAGRILDEAQPPAATVPHIPEKTPDVAGAPIAAAAVPHIPKKTPDVSGAPIAAAVPHIPEKTPDLDGAPISAAVPHIPEKTPDHDGAPIAAAAVPDVKSGTIPPTSEPLTFFMHEILGGSHASARVVTGVVPAASGSAQLPFGRPSNGVFPTNGAGGVPLPNTNIPFASGSNGAVITNTNNANPFGINGQTTGAGVINGAGGSSIVTGGSRLPYVAGGQLPAGSTLQQLLFGTLTVIDDELSEGHEAGAGVVGRAQGFYVASSEDGTSQSMVFTAMFESGHYEDSISFFGVHRIVSEESQIAVIGGTGKYGHAKGYATVKTLPAAEHTTDGAESLLQITVYLS